MHPSDLQKELSTVDSVDLLSDHWLSWSLLEGSVSYPNQPVLFSRKHICILRQSKEIIGRKTKFCGENLDVVHIELWFTQ